MSSGTSIVSNNPLKQRVDRLHVALREINKAVESMTPMSFNTGRASIQRMIRCALSRKQP
jgi:hypothetical protein